jgi:hypothetical protein
VSPSDDPRQNRSAESERWRIEPGLGAGRKEDQGRQVVIQSDGQVQGGGTNAIDLFKVAGMSCEPLQGHMVPSLDSKSDRTHLFPSDFSFSKDMKLFRFVLFGQE